MTKPSTPDGTKPDGTTLPFIPAPRDSRCPLAPPAEFTEWRDSGAPQLASWRGKPTWVISRYQDIRAALVDPRLSADTLRDILKDMTSDEETSVVFARIDDPEHNRQRRMMTREFTFRQVERMRPQIQQFVDDFLDKIIAEGPPADLVRGFALPVPSLVISLLLGVPYQDHRLFQQQTTAALDSRAGDEVKFAAFAAMYNYIVELVARKEREPGDDLISRLLTDYVATGQLHRDTVAMNSVIMLQAGHETTANMISLGTVALLQHPDIWSRLGTAEQPELIGNVVDELMRYLSIVRSQVERVAKEDLTIGGQLIRAGDLVLMNLPAGNWDLEYTQSPQTFDIHRNTRGHLGFGYGAHQCIGASLARVELQVAFGTLARRLPGLRLAVPQEQLKFQNEKEIFGMSELRSPGDASYTTLARARDGPRVADHRASEARNNAARHHWLAERLLHRNALINCKIRNRTTAGSTPPR